MKDRGWISVSIIIAMMVFLIANTLIVTVEASPFTTVTISFEESPSVDVSPGGSDICTVNGEVKVVKVGPDQVKVYLDANSTFQSTSISPAALVFSGPSGVAETQSFSVSIKVPQGTSCSESGTITVFGYWIQGGFQYNIAPVSTIVCVDQYYNMDVSIDKTGFLVEQGDNIDVNLNVLNKGNGDDTFQIDIENHTGWEKQGFALPVPTEVEIEQGANMDVSIRIGIPKSTSGSYLLKICIISKGSESSTTPCRDVITVNLEVISDGQNTDGNGDGNILFGSDFDNILIMPLAIGIVIVVAILAIIIFITRNRVETYTP